MAEWIMKRLQVWYGKVLRQVSRDIKRLGGGEKGWGCWGPKDTPEGLSISYLERLHAIDFPVVILRENFLLDTQNTVFS